jgi:hypothetical protein
MSVATPVVGARRRLNPFLFPSDVDFWLILLVAALVGASLELFAWIHLATVSQAQAQQAACLNVGLPTSAAQAQGAWLALLEKCQGTFDHAKALWMFGGAVLVLLVATIVYRLIPAVMIRRSGYVKLEPDDAGDIMAVLDGLCREAELRRTPTFLVSPNSGAAVGMAMGTSRHPYVVLMAGLLQRYRRDPAAFAGVIRHELAHLRNGDVGKTYFALAAWWAFIFAALLPFAAAMLLHPSFSGRVLWDLGWRTVALALIVYLTRSAVLRQRELYADVRASVWDSASGGLRRLLSGMKAGPAAPWQRPFANHPLPLERQRVVDDTDSLFRIGFWTVFGAGLTFALAFPNVAAMLVAAFTGISGAVTGLTTVLIASTLAALILAPLTVGVVGLGLWRAEFGSVMRGRRAPGVAIPAVALALGTALGGVLSYQSAGGLSGVSMEALLGYAVLYIVWVVLMLVLYAALLQWIRAGALPWLQALAIRRDARRGAALGLAIATALVSGGLGLLFFYRSFIQLGREVLGAGEVGVGLVLLVMIAGLLLAQPLLVPAGVSLWAFPFSSTLLRARAQPPGAGDLFLETGTDRPPFVTSHPLQPGYALHAGSIAAIVGWILLLIHQLLNARSWEPGVVLPLAAMVLPQAIVAALVARRVAVLPVLHGVMAASVAGLLIAVGYEAAKILLAHRDLGGALNAGSLVVNAGVLIALPAAWLSARWMPRQHASGARPAVPATVAWAAVTGAAIVIVGAAAGVLAGVINYPPLDQAEAATLASIASPSLPQFSGELGVQSTADQFVAFAGSHDQQRVALNVTCQYGSQAAANICAAGGPRGSVILLVESGSQFYRFDIGQNAAGVDVVLGARTPASLVLKGSFMVVNGSNVGENARLLTSLGLKQYFLLQPVGSGS